MLRVTAVPERRLVDQQGRGAATCEVDGLGKLPPAVAACTWRPDHERPRAARDGWTKIALTLNDSVRSIRELLPHDPI